MSFDFDVSREVGASLTAAPASRDLPEILDGGLGAAARAQTFCERFGSGAVFDVGLKVHAAKIAKRYPDCNSVSLRDRNSEVLDHSRMPKSAAEIRRDNFIAEVGRAGGHDAFADKYDLNVDYVRQLMNGKGNKGGRNIGDRAARKIDQDHSDPRSTALLGNQLENDIDALRYFAAAMTATIAASRPAEAKALAGAIRVAPPKFSENGFLKELLSTLDKASKRKAKTPPRAPSS